MYAVQIHTMTSYSAIRRNEMMLFIRKMMQLEIILSEINQAQKDKYRFSFSHVWLLEFFMEV